MVDFRLNGYFAINWLNCAHNAWPLPRSSDGPMPLSNRSTGDGILHQLLGERRDVAIFVYGERLGHLASGEARLGGLRDGRLRGRVMRAAGEDATCCTEFWSFSRLAM